MTDGKLDALVAEVRAKVNRADGPWGELTHLLADALAAYRTREQQARAAIEALPRHEWHVTCGFHCHVDDEDQRPFVYVDDLEAIYAKEAAS